MFKTALLITLLFFGGLVLGFLIRPGFDGDPAPVSPPLEAVAVPTPEAPPPVELEDVPSPEVMESDSSPVKTVSAPAGTYESLGEALAAIPVPEYARGDGEISGKIRTKDGEPIPGVLVRSTVSKLWDRNSSSLSRTPGRLEEIDLEKIVLKIVGDTHFERGTTREAVTDANGEYVVTGLPRGRRFDIDAYKRNWSFSTAPGHHRHEELPGATVDMIGTVGVTVPVTVAFADGSVPFKARIEWALKGDQSRGRYERWYPHDPRILLPPGTYSLTAKSGDDNEYGSGSQEITLDLDSEPSPLSFSLKTRPGIRGRVVFPVDEEPEYGYVYLLKSAKDDESTVEQLLRSENRAYAYSRNDYEFTFNDLSPGIYLVGVTRDRRKIAAAQNVEVTETVTELNLEVPAIEAEDYVVLWVYGPDGEILKDVNVNVTYRSDRRSTSGRTTTIKKDDGSMWVLLESQSEHFEGDFTEVTVQVHSSKYGSKGATRAKGDSSEITIEFQEPASLEVTVIGYEGSGYEGLLTLSIERAETGEIREDRRHVRTYGGSSRGGIDSGGTQKFGPVEPGEYKISLALKSSRYQQQSIAEEFATLSAGDNSAGISIPALYSLTVVASGMVGNYLDLRPLQEGSRRSSRNRIKVGESGEIVFEHLPAGDYKLSDMGRSGEMTVSVPGQSKIEYAPVQPNAMEVRVDNPDGGLAKAGFQSGDLIIGLEGAEFESMVQMRTLLMAAMAKDEATLTVLRGRQELELKLDMKGFQDPRGMGGDIEPTTR